MKMLPVMWFSVLILQKHHSCTTWCSASLFILGVILFSAGDAVVSLQSDLTGLVLISLALPDDRKLRGKVFFQDF